MVHALKLWASSHKLNDPSGAKGPATMSSYCLTLMAIAYLQHIGHLPNLQADINVPEVCRPEDTSEHDVVWVSWGKEQGVKAHVGFSLSPPDDWKPSIPNLTAADAIRGFFEFFSLNGSAPLRGEKFDRLTQIVSILQGGIVPRAKERGLKRKKEWERGTEAYQPRNWGEKKLVVQDPFLWFKNCAGMMSREGLDRWWTTVDNTHRVMKLKGKNFTLADLLML
ncbi:hypothetical protein I308_100467 [Cryptococcus tetragattii IND107]|uniref:PAP-associated domain-containing protein n=1 Tax=Cryptococcus tetragattii IND107 TaxID=1296105 RepID=A0ABR3C5Q2_9TREE